MVVDGFVVGDVVIVGDSEGLKLWVADIGQPLDWLFPAAETGVVDGGN